ncbi:MAG: OmpA family protein [Ignavibacteria bacterium]|jgi:outer membrane protein OmpA-like peptidoglycan-associated protein
MRYIKYILNMIVLLVIAHFTCQAQQVMSVTGTVIDQTTRNPVSILVSFYDRNNKKIGSSKSNSATGYYLVTGLKQGETYKVQLESSEFFKDEYEITLPVSKKYADVSRDFTVKPLVKGAKILLEVPPFELKKSKLRVGAEDYLADIKKMLVLNPGVSVEIQTYPDAEGDPAVNEAFTMERAQAIKKYLIDNGVREQKLTVKASGQTDSVNPPPRYKTAKGKRYIGPIYIMITKV